MEGEGGWGGGISGMHVWLLIPLVFVLQRFEFSIYTKCHCIRDVIRD